MKTILPLSAAVIFFAAPVWSASKSSRRLPDVPRFARQLADPLIDHVGGAFLEPETPRDGDRITAFMEPETPRDGDRITAFMEPETDRDGGRSESFDLRTRVAHMAENADKAVEAIAARETTTEGANGGANAAFRALTGEREAPVVAAAEPANASAEQLAALNASIAEALAPINQQPNTRAEVVFTKLATNDQRAVDVAVKLRYQKKGPRGELDVDLQELVYSFPEAPGSIPETRAKLAIKVNLLNFLSQKDINALGPQADKFIAGYLEDYRRRYGSAATLDIRMTHKDYEGEGENRNLTGLGLVFNADIDLSKLPQGRDPKQELLTSIQAQLEIGLKAMEGTLRFLSNPHSRYFERDQRGLKDSLEKLIQRDPKAIEEIRRMVGYLESFAKKAT